MKSSKDIATELLAQALSVTSAEISASTALGVTAQWDSLAHMRLVLALEAHLGKKLGPTEIVGLSCFVDVEALVGA